MRGVVVVGGRCLCVLDGLSEFSCILTSFSILDLLWKPSTKHRHTHSLDTQSTMDTTFFQRLRIFDAYSKAKDEVQTKTLCGAAGNAMWCKRALHQKDSHTQQATKLTCCLAHPFSDNREWHHHGAAVLLRAPSVHKPRAIASTGCGPITVRWHDRLH